MVGPAAPPAPRDAFAWARLLLASLVIVSHTAELADGDGRREPLERLVGTTNLGFVAVYGFFLVSGYLVTGSALASGTGAFLRRRAARIYPGFVAAWLVSVLVVPPLSGGHPPNGGWRLILAATGRMLLLQRPVAEGAFPGQAFHQAEVALNGAMWTVPYEFGCYLLAAAMARAGLARRPWLLVTVAAVLLTAGATLPQRIVAHLALPALLPGPPRIGLALLGMFATGGAFFCLRGRLGFGRRGATVAVAALALAVPVAPLTTPALGLFGGYLLFAAARRAGRSALARLEGRDDPSYGLYLYGWPIEQLLIRYLGTGNLPALAAITWALALAAGWVSWRVVERPVLRRVHAGTTGSRRSDTGITCQPCRGLAP